MKGDVVRDFEKLLEVAKRSLYPGCKKENTLLAFVIEMLQVKVERAHDADLHCIKQLRSCFIGKLVVLCTNTISKELRINCIEFMPCHEFNELEYFNTEKGLLASVVKSSSRSSSIVVLGSASDKFKSSNSASGIPVGKQVHPKEDNNSKKDKPDTNLTRDEDKNEPMEMTLQERSKSSNNPGSRMLHQSRMYHHYAFKHSPVDEKDPARLTSSKASSVESHCR
ncbi:hypothetical protein Dimus_003412 [Dionaea muscipula]